ncbi:hypothetical protein NKH18_15560 [Streptomyces sp. M10(2022)]
MDAQVKVRGMRIDPTDIERALGRLVGVRETAVVVTYNDGGEAELTAFVVPRATTSPRTTCAPACCGPCRGTWCRPGSRTFCAFR